MKPALSIVIPVYNSESTLQRLVDQLARLKIPGGKELILVNDGSRDASAETCMQLAKTSMFPITVVDLARNYGEHNAVLAGLHQVRGKHTIIMDDDFQNPPAEIARLLQHAQKTNCDVVYTYYDGKKHSLWRNFGSWLTNRMADFVLDKPKGLYLSSFKCLNALVVQEIIKYRGPFPYIDGLILQVSRKINSILVAHSPRMEGKSGYTLRKLLRLWMSMLVNFSIMPLRVSTLLGIGLAIVGFLDVLEVVWETLTYHTPAGWASLMAVFLVFSGIQLIMLGLVGEYLGRIYLTVNSKPQFTVRRLCHSKKR
ncbi:MAG: glycosyltransferase family 2 protein [Methylacidiphilales bacterium]|nr:glycosyltransferase family 2 protein [Candidatus Methylacidiphilales bacterium]